MCVTAVFQLSPSPLGGRGGAQAGGGPMSGMRPMFRFILLAPPPPAEEFMELLKLDERGISSGGLKITKKHIYWVNCPPNLNNKDDICTLVFGYPECFSSSSCR